MPNAATCMHAPVAGSGGSAATVNGADASLLGRSMSHLGGDQCASDMQFCFSNNPSSLLYFSINPELRPARHDLFLTGIFDFPVYFTSASLRCYLDYLCGFHRKSHHFSAD